MADNSENKKIVGFKKFTDINAKPKVEEVDPSVGAQPETDSDRPMNPNLSSDSKKIEKPASRKNLIPKEQSVDLPSDKKIDEGKVETIGKIAKFPKGTKASKCFNFLENIKVSKKSIWYIIVERQPNELQMVKYNNSEGVDLNKFVNELKNYYIKEYKTNDKVCKAINEIKIAGNEKYSMVQNIPMVEVNGIKLITRITEDLIKLLSR